MSDLDWKIKRALDVPGPGEYKVDSITLALVDV